MSDYELGPSCGCWVVILTLAGLGFGALIMALGWFALWLWEHLSWA